MDRGGSRMDRGGNDIDRGGSITDRGGHDFDCFGSRMDHGGNDIDRAATILTVAAVERTVAVYKQKALYKLCLNMIREMTCLYFYLFILMFDISNTKTNNIKYLIRENVDAKK